MVMTAICAAIYVAVLAPFKGFVLIPGLTEVRPGAAIPVVMSFLFGPAAAWGSAFGNVMADILGGMLTPVSLFGFIGNFAYGYLPYALWRALMGQTNPVRSGLKGWLMYSVILVTSCLAAGSIIGWGADILHMAPFAALGLIVAINNLIATAALSTVLISLLYDRVRQWGLLYDQIMDEDPATFLPQATDTPAPTPTAKPRNRLALTGATLCVMGTIAAFIPGLWISGHALHAGYGASAFASGTAGTLAVGAGMAPGLLVLVLGTLWLSQPRRKPRSTSNQ